ncbi:PQQ-binding-like beta-propeller repeat protein [Gordonia rubripertincta]|uniref:outer membrane protein assembly factor BamB family protein n=1 Tax=Gordonia rubripertincta TaxID=36822 RepID=UPI00117E9228|nr:PQQ-binding-like beta-propeller repeat protein [Gordonia rubripertincta]TSD96166.1 PQQ-binding-like beta-propeller repeat protein [Gordonia rubripertincta]
MSHPGPPSDGDSDASPPEETPTTIQPARPTVVPGVSLNKDSRPDPNATTPTGTWRAQPDPYASTQFGQSPFPPTGMAPPVGPPGYPPPGHPSPGYPPPGWQQPLGYPPPGYPPPGWQPPSRRRSKTKAYVITGIALACVLALVAGGVVWWKSTRSSEESDLLAGQLTGSYPTAPSAAWTIGAASMGGEKFNSVLPSEGRYGALGAITDGQTLVTLVGGEFTGVSDNWAVGIDVGTGGHWRFSEPVRHCADRIVDHTVVCGRDSDLYFIDTRTGDAIAHVTTPTNTEDVAFNGDAAFLAAFDDAITLYKVTPEGVEWSRPLSPLPEPATGSGDSTYFTATDEAVVYAGLVVYAVSAKDGKTIFAQTGASSEIGRFDDGTLAVQAGTPSGYTLTQHRVVMLRPDTSTAELAGKDMVVPEVVTSNQRHRVLLDGAYADSRDGTTVWTTSMPDVDSYGSRVVVADDREVILFERNSNKFVALDTATGEERWAAEALGPSGASGHAVTDGERLIAATADGGIGALDLATGAPVWELPPATIGNASGSQGRVLTFAIGNRLVTLTSTTITGFAPTGPRAIVPGTTRGSERDSRSGGTEYVTPCGSPPIFTPQTFRTAAGGLVVTMKVTAKCPGGDVLYGPQTRITISDGNGLIASGNFDFQQAPVAVPSDDGSDLTLELTYPPGSFFRLPDTLNDGTSAGAGSAGSGSGGSGAGGGQVLVDCEKGPTSGPAPSLSVPDSGMSTSSVATGAAFPAGTNIIGTSVNALRVQADSDRAFILANLNNRWVAQLSSKRPGLVADGRTWNDQAILDEFLALRLRFNDVRLLWSDEWPVFSYQGWWVTVAAATFPGPVEANNWCRTQGFDPDHCFAKLVSTTAGPDGSTLYWK